MTGLLMLKALAHLKPHFNKYITLQNHSCWRDWCLRRNILQDQFVSSAPVSAQMDLKSYFKNQNNCEMTFQLKWFQTKDLGRLSAIWKLMKTYLKWAWDLLGLKENLKHSESLCQLHNNWINADLSFKWNGVKLSSPFTLILLKM